MKKSKEGLSETFSEKRVREEGCYAFNMEMGRWLSKSEFDAIFLKQYLIAIIPLEDKNKKEEHEQLLNGLIEESSKNDKVNKAMLELDNSVTSSIKKWTSKFNIEDGMDIYYRLLIQQKAQSYQEDESLDNLTKEESTLLRMAENFDVENLKYKNLSKEDKEDSESISRLLENSRQSATLQTDSNTSTTQTTTTSSHSANSSEQSPQMLKQFKKVGRPATETVSKKSEQSCRIN